MRSDGEFLFWFHLLIIALAVMSGLFLPPAAVVILIALHKIHLIVFGDCLLTLLKRYIGAITYYEDFIQFAGRRLFRKTITNEQSKAIQWGIYGMTLFLSVIGDLFYYFLSN